MRSLPYKLQYKITERLEEENTLKSVLDFLLHDIEIQERLDSIADRTKSEPLHQFPPRSSHYRCSPKSSGEDFRGPRSSAVFTVDRQPKCDYCSASHSSLRCNKVVSRQSRLEQTKKTCSCYNCLKQHFRPDWKSRSNCQNCGERHHTSIWIP